jgi:hypothetical protein
VVPLSQGIAGSTSDCLITETVRQPAHLLDLTAEVKARANGEGFRQLAAWLGEHILLLLRRDPQQLLVLMPWEGV